MAVQIQIRRDTEANWTSADPTLAAGEIGFETDTNKLKVGDGSTAWISLSYFGASGDVATDSIFDAKGDLAVGTGADTAAKLTVGTNNHVLTADSGEVTGIKWAASAGGGATTALDNLASVAVNTDITSDTDSTDSLGATGTKWVKAFLDSLSLGEIAAAPADVAGDGQVWVKNTTPNELWFTDDAGTDVQLGLGGGTVDTSGTPVANDIARFTDVDTIEGRSYAELKADLNLEIGTDVLAEQTIGIADDNLVEVDDADVADNDFAKFTLNGLEGRSYAEVRSDINVEDGSTADQTGAQIKTAYEGEADTNAYDDAAVTKLGGVEALADVTDTANVTSAGALMDSEVDADIKTLALPASTTISAFGATVVDDADASAVRTTIGAVIGTDVLAEQTIGIADNNLLEVDQADAASGEYAKFTANGLESKSIAEAQGDLGIIPLSNSNISPVGADQTAVVNTRYFADLSGLSAIRNFILPAGTVGDIIILNITVGDADYEYIVKGDAGITINGAAAATEWSRLFITGESVTLVADTTSNWQVVEDGKIPVKCLMYQSSGATWNNDTYTSPNFAASHFDVGGCADFTNDRFNIRRAGMYAFECRARTTADIGATGAQIGAVKIIEDTPATIAYYQPPLMVSNNTIGFNFSGFINLTLAQSYAIVQFYQSTGENTTMDTEDYFTAFSMVEVL